MGGTLILLPLETKLDVLRWNGANHEITTEWIDITCRKKSCVWRDHSTMAKTTQMAGPTKASEPMATFILSAAAAAATVANHLILSSAAIQIHDEKVLSKI